MSTDQNQDQFIQNIRTALGISDANIREREAALFTDSETIPAVQQQHIDTVKSRDKAEQEKLLQRLIEEGKPLNLEVVPLKDEAAVSRDIARLVAETTPEWGGKKSIAQWDHPLIRDLKLEEALKDQNVPVYTAAFDGEESPDDGRRRIRQQVTDSYIGVTSADFCLADTASLVMRSRPGEARSVSLLPSIHVAVIRLDQILFDLKELYALIKWDPENKGLPHHMVFISGPSKTADIELVMVHGAHGPRALRLYVITD